MTIWEFDVELRVRKTLTFRGPATEDVARSVLAMVLSEEIDASHVICDGRLPCCPVTIETFIDNDPPIVAVREIPVIIDCRPGNSAGKAPGVYNRTSTESAWLMAIALEVEAGRLSLDEARQRLQRRGLTIAETVQGPAQ